MKEDLTRDINRDAINLMSLQELEKKLQEWHSGFTEDINNNFIGRSYLDNTVAAAAIRGLVSDMNLVLGCLRVLTAKVACLSEQPKEEGT